MADAPALPALSPMATTAILAATSVAPPGQDVPDPSSTSSDYKSCWADWTRIKHVLAGLDVMRANCGTYLPKYEDETEGEYQRRVSEAPWRPEFADALESISSRPFSRDIIIKNEVSDVIVGKMDDETKSRRGGFVDDVDGRGNNLTSFGRDVFGRSVAMGVHGILVDFPHLDDGKGPGAPRTLAQDKAEGVRPYLIHIDADDMLACYTEVRGGHEVVTHVRFRENIKVRDGFKENLVERIRVMEPGKWWQYELRNVQRSSGGPLRQWIVVDEGLIRRGPKGDQNVPLVLFFTGERSGVTAVKPPLAELAHMQIELFRAGSREEEVLTYAGSPMLSATGMAKPTGDKKISVGPKRVLYAPAGTTGNSPKWEFIQPDAANITAVSAKVQSITEDMRRLGQQPLTQQSGSPTATGQSIDAAKTNSTAKAWAMRFNDALEQAFVYVCEWYGLEDTVQTQVSTDFLAMPYAAVPLTALQAARTGRDISQRTLWTGLMRFNVLPEDFDPESEEQALADEAANQDPNADDADGGPPPAPGEDDDPEADSLDPNSFGDASDLKDADLRSIFGNTVADAAGLAR